MLRSKATPCGGSEQGSSFETCTSQCLVACGKSSACTTAIVKDKVGDGRACENGRLGQDDVGACVPAFGEVKDAWSYFAANCTACGDSDACQAACKTIMDKAPFVVDETRAHPDVCPSFDCPDCVGPCTSCSATDCVRWCDARHEPTAHCTAGGAVSVQGLFADQSLKDRTTAAEKAMGTFYDNRCKTESVQRAYDYFAAFTRPVTRIAPPVRRRTPPVSEAAQVTAQQHEDYINERVRRAEQLRARQLDALGIGTSLRSFTGRRVAATVVRPAAVAATKTPRHVAAAAPPSLALGVFRAPRAPTAPRAPRAHTAIHTPAVRGTPHAPTTCGTTHVRTAPPVCGAPFVRGAPFVHGAPFVRGASLARSASSAAPTQSTLSMQNVAARALPVPLVHVSETAPTGANDRRPGTVSWPVFRQRR